MLADENTHLIAKEFDSLFDALGELDGTGNKIIIDNGNFVPTPAEPKQELVHNVPAINRPYQPPVIDTKFSVSPVHKGQLTLYKVHLPNSNICVLDNVYDKRAASFIASSLNSGKTLADKKLLGIICICMEMNAVIADIERAVTERMQVIKECKYDKAQLLDAELKTLYQKTDVVKAKLNKYMG